MARAAAGISIFGKCLSETIPGKQFFFSHSNFEFSSRHAHTQKRKKYSGTQSTVFVIKQEIFGMLLYYMYSRVRF